MRYEKVINRENGDIIKLVTILSANVFLEIGYEVDQFALVKKVEAEDWQGFYHKTSPKNISRQDYIENYKPKTLLGVISIGEAIKAGIEAKDLFLKANNLK